MIRSKFSTIISTTLFLFIFASHSISTNAQGGSVDAKLGKGVNFVSSDSSIAIKMGARIQNLFIYTSNIGDNGWYGDQTNFLTRRARLKFDGWAFNKKVVYKMEFGLSNRDIGSVSPEVGNTARVILDAAVKWKAAKNFEIWAGQTKLPGNRERVVSSQKLQFVDRSDVNGRFNIDRDVGVQLRHKMKFGDFEVRNAFAISQGEGRNVTRGNIGGLEYTARMELLPMGSFTSKGDYFSSDLKREQKPKLSLGFTVDYNDRSPKQRGNLGSYMQDDFGNYYMATLETFFFDMMFKYRGFSMLVEYANKDSQDPVRPVDASGNAVGTFYLGSGYTAQAGYLFKSNWEIAARYTQIDPLAKTGRESYNMTTLGFSRYVRGHSLKVQGDVSYYVYEVSDPKFMSRLQVEVAF